MTNFQSKFSIDKHILLAILLIDDTNNHEYFSHKYNISNELKENLNLLASNFIKFYENKKFFSKRFKKKYFLFWKKNLKKLNLFTFQMIKNIIYKII